MVRNSANVSMKISQFLTPRHVKVFQVLLHSAIIHHHHFWLALLRVCSATHSQQPPEWLVLSHIDCFSQCEIMGLRSSINISIIIIYYIHYYYLLLKMRRLKWHYARTLQGHFTWSEKGARWNKLMMMSIVTTARTSMGFQCNACKNSCLFLFWESFLNMALSKIDYWYFVQFKLVQILILFVTINRTEN